MMRATRYWWEDPSDTHERKLPERGVESDAVWELQRYLIARAGRHLRPQHIARDLGVSYGSLETRLTKLTHVDPRVAEDDKGEILYKEGAIA